MVIGHTGFYAQLGWTNEEVPTIVASLNYVARNCKLADARLVIDLRDNKFSDSGKAALKACGVDGKIKIDLDSY